MSILGTRVVRIEDPRLLTAGGTYVDDVRVPELLGAAPAPRPLARDALAFSMARRDALVWPKRLLDRQTI